MIIELENIHTEQIIIQDLGIELNPQEKIELLTNFTRDEILLSQDLEIIYNNGYISFTLDSESKTFIQIIKTLAGLTESNHETLDTLKHSLSEPSYFQIERNISEDVEKIVYYKDNTLNVKIREDEIVRNIDDDVIQIIKRQYDSLGNVIETETQNINRIDGDVISIDTIKS